MGSLYSEQPTWLHAVPAYLKLMVLALWGTGMFLVDQLSWLTSVTVICLLMFASLGRAVQRVKPLLLGLLIGSVLVGGFHVWMGQPALAALTVMRLIDITLLGIALTLTTRYSDLLGVLELLLSPLKRIGLKTDQLALQLALMLRFTEHFFVTWRRLDDSYRVRSGKPGGFKILAPLTIQMLVAARRVADALQVRLRR